MKLKIKVYFFSLLKEAMDSSGKQEEKERDRVDSGNDGEIYLYDERTA